MRLILFFFILSTSCCEQIVANVRAGEDFFEKISSNIKLHFIGLELFFAECNKYSPF
jgi:hypothetical protein